MRCFIHREKEAIAVCRACGKGLCPECGTDTGRGLGCRGICEQEIRDYVQLIDRSIEFNKKGVGAVNVLQSERNQSAKKETSLTTTVAAHIHWTRRFRSSVGIFHCLVGIIFLGWGISNLEEFLFALFLGISFLAYGVFILVQGRPSASVQKSNNETQTR